MKVLVTYHTETGNTAKLAQAIYDALATDKDLLTIDKVKKTDDYDLMFIGFPVDAHSVPFPVQRFISGLPPGKPIAFFSTHGSLRDGHLPRQAFENAFALAARATVLGHFGSRGQVKPELIDDLMKKQEHRAWAEEALGAKGHPNELDLQDARSFADLVITRYHRRAAGKKH